MICRVEAKPHTSPHTGARRDGVSSTAWLGSQLGASAAAQEPALPE